MNMYFIAIVLPEHLNQKFMSWKNLMHEKYGCRVALKSPAHITLVPPFWMDEEKEEQLLIDLDSLANSKTFFTLSTNHFSAFKPRTIFAAVMPSEELNQLKKQTDIFFKDHSLYKIKPETRPFHPHITIATRDLHKKDFHEAWPLFEEKKFVEEWKAEGISLLRHNKKNWDVVHTSQFRNI